MSRTHSITRRSSKWHPLLRGWPIYDGTSRNLWVIRRRKRWKLNLGCYFHYLHFSLFLWLWCSQNTNCITPILQKQSSKNPSIGNESSWLSKAAFTRTMAFRSTEPEDRFCQKYSVMSHTCSKNRSWAEKNWENWFSKRSDCDNILRISNTRVVCLHSGRKISFVRENLTQFKYQSNSYPEEGGEKALW